MFAPGIELGLTVCAVKMTTFSQINSPVALAAFGAFFVPEPLGMCLVLAAGFWWLTQVASVVKARRWTGGKHSNDKTDGVGCVSVSRSARRVGDLSADGKIPRQRTVS